VTTQLSAGLLAAFWRRAGGATICDAALPVITPAFS